MADSSESQIKDLRGEIKNDSIRQSSCDSLQLKKDELIASQNKNTDFIKEELQHERFWRRFWKTSTGVIAIIGTGEYFNNKLENK